MLSVYWGCGQHLEARYVRWVAQKRVAESIVRVDVVNPPLPLAWQHVIVSDLGQTSNLDVIHVVSDSAKKVHGSVIGASTDDVGSDDDDDGTPKGTRMPSSRVWYGLVCGSRKVLLAHARTQLIANRQVAAHLQRRSKQRQMLRHR